MQKSKLEFKRTVVISLITLGVISISLFLILRKITQPVSYKPKAVVERTPDPKCSLEVNVIEEATPIPTQAASNTPVPPTPTSIIRPTATATPTLCPNVTPGAVSCPASLPTPPGNVYPDINNQTLAGSNIVQKGQTVTVTFEPNAYVVTRKLCIRKCTNSAYTSCDLNWGIDNGGSACAKLESGSSISLDLSKHSSLITSGYYQLLVAGYSSDNNYACSSQLFYTANSTADPAPTYCPLGAGCGCSNKPINIEIAN